MTRKRNHTFPSEHGSLGWADYVAGNPYPAAYDLWREVDQRNYENGRYRAANYALATGRALPSRHPKQGIYLAAIAVVGAAYFNASDSSRSVPKMHAARQRIA